MYKLIVLYNSPKLDMDVKEEFTFDTKEKFNSAYKGIVLKNHELGVEHVEYDFEINISI
ncbi:hypothetical protein [Bacillus sp. 3P20]|uniref:hypothetical protein n=1 Tax=Bacillus sp. 3P20 TaxID=3079309 RepID=UPI0039B5E921